MRDYIYEPDFICFWHNGMECQIKRHHFGFLNAYVLLPEYSDNYGVDELSLNSKLKFSTEITYSEPEGERWRVGISFSSIKDFIPYEPKDNEFAKMVDSFYEKLGIKKATESDYKNLNYAINEVKKLADALHASRN